MLALVPPPAEVCEDVSFHPDSIATPLLDLALRQAAADVADTARCPLCRLPLTARMTRAGPRFVCGCEAAPRKI